MGNGSAKFIQHKGKDILLIDFSHCNAQEIIDVVNEAKKMIQSQPYNSVLTLTVATNASFSADVIEVMKLFVASNKPYVKAGAIFGLSGLNKALYAIVMTFSGRNIPLFNDLEEAKNWLISR